MDEYDLYYFKKYLSYCDGDQNQDDTFSHKSDLNSNLLILKQDFQNNNIFENNSKDSTKEIAEIEINIKKPNKHSNRGRKIGDVNVIVDKVNNKIFDPSENFEEYKKARK